MSSNWQHKLKEYSPAPPPAAWDSIAERLEAQEAQFPQKLHQFEATPPAAAWANIENRLPGATGAPVVPLQARVLRYAAAAVVLLALAGIAFWATPRNENAVAAHTAAPQPQSSTPAAPPAKREIKHFNVPPQSEPERPATAAPQRSSLQYAAAAASRRLPPKRTQANLPLEPAFATELDVVPETQTLINTERANRYMVATLEEGEAVRLPKKVYSAFACPDEDPAAQACERQLAQLQQKISASFTTDFAHFLDLLKNLQENSK